jgi:outer membrane receptor for ferrienterochelin and colicin
MSASENLDARVEGYPRAGELISFGLFAKKISDPIELTGVTSDNELIVYENYDQADVFGIEVELRKNFRGFWGAPWDQVSMGVNYAYIKSEVDLTALQQTQRAKFGDTADTRPLYDQPEFVINGDFTWDNFVTGTTITLNGGVTGRRLVLVGLASPDEYEEPAPYLDFAISQKMGRYWKMKFSAKNLLDPVFETTQTWPSLGTVPIKSYKKGRSFGISFSADF